MDVFTDANLDEESSGRVWACFGTFANLTHTDRANARRSAKGLGGLSVFS